MLHSASGDFASVRLMYITNWMSVASTGYRNTVPK
jgi:hypothetical protein